jgi:hypothetical protein
VIRSSRSGVPLRGLLVAVAATLIPAITACEAGFNAPTQEWHPPTPGAHRAVGLLRIDNMFVLGAPPGASLAPGSSAGVFLALANTGTPDTLASISAPGTATAVTLPGGQVRVGKNQSVLLTGPVPRVVLQGLTRSVQGGQAVRMVLTFVNAGRVTLYVPVMPRAQYYSTYSPVPPPSPPATTKPRHKHRPPASPSGGASPTVSPSP